MCIMNYLPTHPSVTLMSSIPSQANTCEGTAYFHFRDTVYETPFYLYPSINTLTLTCCCQGRPLAPRTAARTIVRGAQSPASGDTCNNIAVSQQLFCHPLQAYIMSLTCILIWGKVSLTLYYHFPMQYMYLFGEGCLTLYYSVLLPTFMWEMLYTIYIHNCMGRESLILHQSQSLPTATHADQGKVCPAPHSSFITCLLQSYSSPLIKYIYGEKFTLAN